MWGRIAIAVRADRRAERFNFRRRDQPRHHSRSGRFLGAVVRPVQDGRARIAENRCRACRAMDRDQSEHGRIAEPVAALLHYRHSNDGIVSRWA